MRIGTDYLGTLAYNAPNITIGSALLTIGGRQYFVNGGTIALPVLIGNSLYKIYGVIVGGSVQYVISLNENSVGPAGYTRWKLVGAFVTGYAAVMGDFLAIDTLTPSLLVSAGKSNPQAYININYMRISSFTAGSSPYFDLVNGYFRPPIAALFDVNMKVTFDNVSGTANTINSNVYSRLVRKVTLPAAPDDVDLTFQDNNTVWFTGVEPTAPMIGSIYANAGDYIWCATASNLVGLGAQIIGVTFVATLRNIAKKIKDL